MGKRHLFILVGRESELFQVALSRLLVDLIFLDHSHRQNQGFHETYEFRSEDIVLMVSVENLEKKFQLLFDTPASQKRETADELSEIEVVRINAQKKVYHFEILLFLELEVIQSQVFRKSFVVIFEQGDKVILGYSSFLSLALDHKIFGVIHGGRVQGIVAFKVAPFSAISGAVCWVNRILEALIWV